MHFTRWAIGFELFAVSVAFREPAVAQSTRPFPLPIAIDVRMLPAPIMANGTHYLIYELDVINYMASTAHLKRVEVFAESRLGSALIAYEGQDLIDNINRPGLSLDPDERPGIGAASHAMVYMYIPVEAGQPVPQKLHHQVTFEVESSDSSFTDVVDFDTQVLPRTEVIEIGPPLKGGPWVALNGPSNTSGHRRTPIPHGGRPGLAQRYAIDYMLLDREGRFFAGDSTKNENYAGHGQEVIAVSDATVVTAYNGVPENTPFVTSRPEVFNITTAIGNHIILDLGSGRYALYAHLQPGSLRAKEGDYVRRGQTLGLVGNAGNSGGPHLHFHLVDRNSPLGAEGLPYTHNAFEWFGKCEISAISDTCSVGAGQRRVGQTPLRNDIVRFPR